MLSVAGQPASAQSRPRGPSTGSGRAAPRPRLGPVPVLAAIGLGAVAVIALWWSDTPSVSGLGDWLTGAGRILGLLAGYGVVVLVALMARLPPLERGIGADRLARWHAMGGRYVVSVVVAHAVLITWGYAVAAHEGVINEAGTLLTSYPDVLMATVAGALLLAVGLVSARAARRRTSYETWYYLHLYTYLAIALAFSHQFADGASFVSSLRARAVWSALYLTVAAGVVWYRVLSPLRSAARHRFRVVGVRRESADVVSVYIGGRHLDELRAEPGQFFRWRFLARGVWWSSHPYSLSALPRPDVMRITVKDRGDHSGSMSRLRPGTRVIAEGPYGAFIPARSGRRILLLAGGVGITPLRAMFAMLPGGVTLVYRASSPDDIVFGDELDAIARERGATVHYLIGSRARLGSDPLSARTLKALVPGLHRHDVYLCGPAGMAESALDALGAAGVPRRRIHYESFEF
ncbi:MAG TPA: ferredoxin reductase family protein [Streptosporangiaceae bacterium]|nr:ferredoxin reductase family protein [Streptosporangiaceae bacterium]